MIRVPKRITPCPLIDAIVEIRFDSSLPADAVFGMAYGQLKETYSKVSKLPILNLPDMIRNKDPDLVFQPQYKLSSDDKFVVQLGPRVLSVASPGEYVGWEAFFIRIRKTYDAIKPIGIINTVTRLGIRYINFFDFDIYEKINLQIRLNDEPLSAKQSTVKLEIQEDKFGHLLQVASNVMVENKPKGPRKGSVIDIDTHIEGHFTDFFDKMEATVLAGHQAEKQLFFSLLMPDFLASLNPEY